MAVFVVIPTSREADIRRAIEARADLKTHRLPGGQWLVSYGGTSKSLSDELGISGGATGNAVIVSVGGYYGNAPNDIWEWLKQHWTGT